MFTNFLYLQCRGFAEYLYLEKIPVKNNSKQSKDKLLINLL